jgi:CRP-like cAMP-binding protein
LQNQTDPVAQGDLLAPRKATPARPVSPSPQTDGDGNHIHNQLLADLPANECEVACSEIEFVRLNLHQILHEPGDTLKSAYFCNSGLVSILSVFPDGKSIEVGLIGKEGFVGLPLMAGFRTASTRAVVQGEGSAFRVDDEALMVILRRCPQLERRMQQFSQIMTMQVTQIAACNRLHEVEERLARWLLMSADRIGSDALPLTQEFLAQMLGTRRSSVTVAAGILQKAGLISHSRGAVTITDRPRLEEAACDCYGMMQRQIKTWQNRPR